MIDTSTGLLITAGVALFGGGKVWDYVIAERKAKAERGKEARAADAAAVVAAGSSAEAFAATLAHFQGVLVQQSESFTRILLDERVSLERARGEDQKRMDALEKEATDCHGENRQLWQTIESLGKLLRAHGIPVPELSPARGWTVFQDGVVTEVAPLRDTVAAGAAETLSPKA